MSMVTGIDHVHVEVSDRAAAAEWYGRILDLVPDPRFAVWAQSSGGPLFLSTPEGQTCLALFERRDLLTPNRDGTIAFSVLAKEFIELLGRLPTDLALNDRLAPVKPVDHGLSWSIYFSDPDGTRIEVTCYDYGTLRATLAP
jgi:catechol-2,3-dioxygenase